jgi:hypothetical protein
MENAFADLSIKVAAVVNSGSQQNEAESQFQLSIFLMIVKNLGRHLTIPAEYFEDCDCSQAALEKVLIFCLASSPLNHKFRHLRRFALKIVLIDLNPLSEKMKALCNNLIRDQDRDLRLTFIQTITELF